MPFHAVARALAAERRRTDEDMAPVAMRISGSARTEGANGEGRVHRDLSVRRAAVFTVASAAWTLFMSASVGAAKASRMGPGCTP